VKASLALRQTQRLSLAPELRQALGLLQLSAVELGVRVQEALEQNVLLERGEEAEASGEAPGPAETEVPLEAAADWDSAEPAPVSGWDDNDSSPAESADRGGQSLKDYLLWQLELARLSPQDAAIGAALIDSLNDDGYLTEPLEDIRLGLADSDAAPEADEVQAVLHRIQSFDPPGIAARGLKECLLLQLRQNHAARASSLATRLVELHLESLAARDYERLCRNLGVSRPELDAAVALIQSLHPRPGSTVTAPSADYVIPDVLVSRADGKWRVELNPEAVPRVRVNPGYAAALRRRSEVSSDLA
jgi:RNA polymerase sigma-54 factor